MGWLSALFGGGSSNVRTLDDHIWLSQEAKLHGLKKEVESLQDADAVLLVAHFSDVLEQMRDVQESARIDSDVCLAEDLSDRIVDGWGLREDSTLLIVVGERHPLSSPDKRIQEFAEGLRCRCRIVFHLSFEDPLMEFFGTESLKPMLQRLGMRDDEALTSGMVTKRIRGVQKKTEAGAFGNQRAGSAAEWLTLNVPELNE